MEPVTFVEIGAYRGFTTDVVLEDQRDWDIVAVEPNPEAFEVLEDKYVCEPRVRLVKIAMSNREGLITLYLSDIADGSSTHKEKRNLVNPRKVVSKCVSASEFVRALNCERVILDINCEGEELEIMHNLMDSGMYIGLKIFLSCHANTVADEATYKEMMDRAKALHVDFISGTYMTLRRRSENLPGGIRQRLKEVDLPHWMDWFAEGPVYGSI